MSNAAASGGYYIAMNSEKIFAHPTTITGSIGVFGVKFDASKWANSYGISGDSYPRGSHATAQHPLTPLTPGTKGNISRQVLDYYDYFKRIVATGRSLSLDQVEKVAQGRVWTGEQAKEVGLVDELGGLERAISYAKTTHTNTEEVDVDHWPKKKGLLASILQPTAMVLGGANDDPLSIEQLLSEMPRLTFADKPHFLMTMDENTALDIILRGE
jgi:protease IV